MASDFVFGGVYKLVAKEQDGKIVPKIKISENVEKITIPGFKQVWRLYDNESGKAEADVITLFDEVIESGKPYELFDPEHTWKRKTIENFTARPLLEKIFDKGECVFKERSINEIRDYCAKSMDEMWAEVCRFENPHNYYVDLSQKLWDMRKDLLDRH